MPSFLKPYSPGAPLTVSGLPSSEGSGGLASSGASSTTATQLGSTLLGGPGPDTTSNYNYAAQIAELDRRARLLDENNRQLHGQLAQAQQLAQSQRERADLMQQQLGDMSAQLQQARVATVRSPINPGSSLNPAAPSYGSGSGSSQVAIGDSRNSLTQPSSSIAEGQRKSGARLTANTNASVGKSAGGSWDALRGLGYPVETNGVATRVRIPSDQFFQPGTAEWTASGPALLERVSQAIRAGAPSGKVLIDSYTDSAGLTNSLGIGNTASQTQQLTAMQSNAISEHLIARGGWLPGRLTTRANGSDVPLMDNQTPAGRAANRRIEFVISE